MRLPLLPRWLRWTMVVAVAALIAVYSVVPLPPGLRTVGPFSLLPLRRYIHLIAYAGLAGVLVYALADTRWSDAVVLGAVFAIAVGYGVGLELLQRVVPYRRFEVGDLVLNAIGTTVAVVGWRVLLSRVRFYQVRATAR